MPSGLSVIVFFTRYHVLHLMISLPYASVRYRQNLASQDFRNNLAQPAEVNVELLVHGDVEAVQFSHLDTHEMVL